MVFACDKNSQGYRETVLVWPWSAEKRMNITATTWALMAKLPVVTWVERTDPGEIDTRVFRPPPSLVGGGGLTCTCVYCLPTTGESQGTWMTGLHSQVAIANKQKHRNQTVPGSNGCTRLYIGRNEPIESNIKIRLNNLTLLSLPRAIAKRYGIYMQVDIVFFFHHNVDVK